MRFIFLVFLFSSLCASDQDSSLILKYLVVDISKLPENYSLKKEACLKKKSCQKVKIISEPKVKKPTTRKIQQSRSYSTSNIDDDDLDRTNHGGSSLRDYILSSQDVNNAKLLLGVSTMSNLHPHVTKKRFDKYDFWS